MYFAPDVNVFPGNKVFTWKRLNMSSALYQIMYIIKLEALADNTYEPCFRKSGRCGGIRISQTQLFFFSLKGKKCSFRKGEIVLKVYWRKTIIGKRRNRLPVTFSFHCSFRTTVFFFFFGICLRQMPLWVQYGILKIMHRILCNTEGNRP